MHRSRSSTRRASVPESNNLAAIESLTGYRALAWGRHLELLLTDQRSDRSKTCRPAGGARAYPARISPSSSPKRVAHPRCRPGVGRWACTRRTFGSGEKAIVNFRKDDPPQTLLGSVQKKWFLERLVASRATWKIWGNTLGTLDYRIDPPEPASRTPHGPGLGPGMPACVRPMRARGLRRTRADLFVRASGEDHGLCYPRGRSAQLLGGGLPRRTCRLSGSSRSASTLWSGRFLPWPAGKARAEPAGVTSASVRWGYLVQRASGSKPTQRSTCCCVMACACLEYQRTGDIRSAREHSNRQLSPHLSFVDVGGHGYATVQVSAEAVRMRSSSASQGQASPSTRPMAALSCIA